MRVGIVGAGLAGAVLAWRFACDHSGVRVHLFDGHPEDVVDATAISGGLVRCFEPEPLSCLDAAASMCELLASPVLRSWAGYSEIGSLYLLPDGPPPGDLVDEVHRAVPRSLRLLSAAEIAVRYGLRGLPPRTVAVHERRAGYVSPANLRRALIADAVRRGLILEPGAVTAVTDDPGCRLDDGRTVRCDVVVVAAGRWTGRLLTVSGLPRWPLRTKRIQYGVYPSPGPMLPAFVDESTGLYGRGMPSGQVLLGMPDHRWDVASQDLEPDVRLATRVRAAAAARFPVGRLGPPRRLVVGADSYHPQPGLRLRQVSGAVYTFAGGSGGAVKTALAASRTAIARLVAGLRAEPSALSGSGLEFGPRLKAMTRCPASGGGVGQGTPT